MSCPSFEATRAKLFLANIHFSMPKTRTYNRTPPYTPGQIHDHPSIHLSDPVHLCVHLNVLLHPWASLYVRTNPCMHLDITRRPFTHLRIPVYTLHIPLGYWMSLKTPGRTCIDKFTPLHSWTSSCTFGRPSKTL